MSKKALTIFLKLGLPVIAIFALCFTMYLIFAKPVNTLERVLTSQTEQRIEDTKTYEKMVYDANLAEVENEKVIFFIIGIGMFFILMLFAFHVIKLMIGVHSNIFLFPEKYETVLKEEADAIRFVKDKLLEKQMISGNQPLSKTHIIKLLSFQNYRE